MICAIHQPNFCPRMGYFEKIEQADIFVLLNNAIYPKNNFVNRFYCKERWYTMRCNQSHKPIIEKRYLYPREDWMKITNQLPKLKVFDECIDSSICLMNEGIIRTACDMLNIPTLISVDFETDLTGTDRLIDICQVHNCDSYLSGVSGRNYLEMDKFEQAGIKVLFQQNPDKRALVELL